MDWPDDTAFLQKPGIAYQLSGEEAVLIDARSRFAHRLNRVGAALWLRLETPATLPDLVDTICAAFDVEPELARADTIAFLSALAEKGLLVENAAVANRLPSGGAE